jgi:hypothetical protein
MAKPPLTWPGPGAQIKLQFILFMVIRVKNAHHSIYKLSRPVLHKIKGLGHEIELKYLEKNE